MRAAYSVPFDAPGGPLGFRPPHGWHRVFAGYWHTRICDPESALDPPWKTTLVPVHSVDLSRFSPSRSRIKAARQAERRGLVLEELSGFSDELYGLYLRVKAIRRGLILSAPAMQALFSEMRGHIIGFIARQDARPIAFILNLVHNRRAFSYLHGFDRRFASLRPMSALVLRSIESAREGGCSEFSLGSTIPGDPGQAAFKESFGATPRPMRIHIKRWRILGFAERARGPFRRSI